MGGKEGEKEKRKKGEKERKKQEFGLRPRISSSLSCWARVVGDFGRRGEKRKGRKGKDQIA